MALGKIITTVLNIVQAAIPVQRISRYLNDKPAKDLKAETERRRAERDKQLQEKK